jgi:ribosome-associated protein
MSSSRKITAQLLSSELDFLTSRSSGPGGQNVNKVNSKVALRFDVGRSSILSQDERDLLLKKLASRITAEGVLVVAAQEKRSQLQNKEAVIVKFDKLLAKAFEKKKPRKATKPTKGSVQDRIKNKKQHAEKKKWRQKPM